jgi:L-malate glycosyltransferase
MRSRSLRIFISHPSHFLTDSEPHGDGLLAFQYIARLARRGHELHVAVPIMSLRNPVPANVHLHSIGSFTRTSSVNPPPQNRLEYAIRVRSLLRRLQRHLTFDLIHQLNPVVPGMSLFLASCGVPIVLGPIPPHIAEERNSSSSSAALPRRLALMLRDRILHRQLKDASLILIPTAKSLELIPPGTEIRTKVHSLNYGIDTDKFQPADSTDESGTSILFLANLMKRKGILELIEAFEIVAKSDKQCALLIAGSGPDEGEVRERAIRSPVAARIEFLGQISRDDVPKVLNASTVYCLPSFEEPFGMTALEAMACGRPVVGARTGGLGLLLDNDGSVMVEPGNVPELASALQVVLSSPERRVKMGMHNRHRVQAEFSWDSVIDRLEDMYALLLDRGERRTEVRN